MDLSKSQDKSMAEKGLGHLWIFFPLHTFLLLPDYKTVTINRERGQIIHLSEPQFIVNEVTSKVSLALKSMSTMRLNQDCGQSTKHFSCTSE